MQWLECCTLSGNTNVIKSENIKFPMPKSPSRQYILVGKKKIFTNGYIRKVCASNVNIPDDINNLIMSFYTMRPLLGSEMLTNDEEEQLVEWIGDSKEYDVKLLFKATRDGFGSAEFHKKCNGKGANISIIKSEQQCIFGGYVSKSWHNKNKFISDDFAWLYSLRNKKGIQKKCQIVKNKHLAMYGGKDFGPCYGSGDLLISNNCNENENSCTHLGRCYEGTTDIYKLNHGVHQFKVLDYEIWQIKK